MIDDLPDDIDKLGIQQGCKDLLDEIHGHNQKDGRTWKQPAIGGNCTLFHFATNLDLNEAKDRLNYSGLSGDGWSVVVSGDGFADVDPFEEMEKQNNDRETKFDAIVAAPASLFWEKFKDWKLLPVWDEYSGGEKDPPKNHAILLCKKRPGIRNEVAGHFKVVKPEDLQPGG